MTEKHIQDALWVEHGRRCTIMCPNYTPAGWWESDVWLVTKAGFGVEFEIKISVADFKADAAKKNDRMVRDEQSSYGWKRADERKHDLLVGRSLRGPSRFYYVVPSDLPITPDMVPEWAGLLKAEHGVYADNFGKIHQNGRTHLREEKPAPRLHKTKADPKTVEHCRSVFYYRYWHLRTGMKTEDLRLAEPPEDSAPEEAIFA